MHPLRTRTYKSTATPDETKHQLCCICLNNVDIQDYGKVQFIKLNKTVCGKCCEVIYQGFAWFLSRKDPNDKLKRIRDILDEGNKYVEE